MRIYCSYCDHRYLPRAIALLRSMERQGFEGEFWVLCLSDECYEILSKMQISRIRAIHLTELEAAYPALLATKPRRETIEYYYTCTPVIMHFVFANAPSAQWVTYLDSDLWFFASPDEVFNEIGDAPVAIVPHNFAPRRRKLERFGIYNVGWITFRRSDEGTKCLEWWKDSCIEWCYGRIEGDRFADQRYLDRFPSIAPTTAILRHKGCNLAPWNVENYTITFKGGDVLVDGSPLIFFHFHGIKKAMRVFYFDNHRSYGAPHSRTIRNHIYKPYISALLEAGRLLAGYSSNVGGNGVKLRGARFGGFDVKNLARSTLRTVYQIADLLQGRPILVRKSRVI